MSHYVLLHAEEGLYSKAPQPPFRPTDPLKPPLNVRLELFKKGDYYAASFFKRTEREPAADVWTLDLPYLDLGTRGGTPAEALAAARHTVRLRYGDQVDAGDDEDVN